MTTRNTTGDKDVTRTEYDMDKGFILSQIRELNDRTHKLGDKTTKLETDLEYKTTYTPTGMSLIDTVNDLETITAEDRDYLTDKINALTERVDGIEKQIDTLIDLVDSFRKENEALKEQIKDALKVMSVYYASGIGTSPAFPAPTVKSGVRNGKSSYGNIINSSIGGQPIGVYKPADDDKSLKTILEDLRKIEKKKNKGRSK